MITDYSIIAQMICTTKVQLRLKSDSHCSLHLIWLKTMDMMTKETILLIEESIASFIKC